MTVEHDNLRTAFDWLGTYGDPESLLRLAASMWRFWYHDSHVDEGGRRLARAVAAGQTAPIQLRREALIGSALLAHFREADADAAALCDEALALCCQDGDAINLAPIHYVQGLIDEDTGRYEATETSFGEALSLFAAAGDDFWVGMTRTHLWIAAYGRRDLARARATLNDALAWQRTRGYRWEVARTLLFLAQGALAGSDAEEGRSSPSEALARSVEQGAPRSLAHDVVSTVAVLALAVGQPAETARILGWAAASREMAGGTSHLPERALYERAESDARAKLGPRAFVEAWEAGRALTADQVFAAAKAVVAGDSVTAATGADARTKVGESATLAALTPREIVVLRMVSRRFTDKEIAEELMISPRTVMHHVSSVLGKLGATTRREAAGWAKRHDLE